MHTNFYFQIIKFLLKQTILMYFFIFFSEIYFKSPSLQKSIPIREVKAVHIGRSFIIMFNGRLL